MEDATCFKLHPRTGSMTIALTKTIFFIIHKNEQRAEENVNVIGMVKTIGILSIKRITKLDDHPVFT